MSCEYYTQSALVINYYNDKGELITITTNITMGKGYIVSIYDEDSDDDLQTEEQKWREQINKVIKNNTYHKILFENDTWIKKAYENKYLPELKTKCPNLVTLIKIYKDYTAWEKS